MLCRPALLDWTDRPMCPMPPLPDWLSWDFWAKDSQGLYHLSLMGGGVIGIVLLAWWTISANRSAWAAVEQAKAAVEQAKIALKQAERPPSGTKRKQSQIGSAGYRSFAKAVEQLGSDKLEPASAAYTRSSASPRKASANTGQSWRR
jgi:hypothetical protein